MSLFLKFDGITSFLILILTNDEQWYGNGSTHSILQTKQKNEEWENDGLTHSSNQMPYKLLAQFMPTLTTMHNLVATSEISQNMKWTQYKWKVRQTNT
jgi:hypothetical protein